MSVIFRHHSEHQKARRAEHASADTELTRALESAARMEQATAVALPAAPPSGRVARQKWLRAQRAQELRAYEEMFHPDAIAQAQQAAPQPAPSVGKAAVEAPVVQAHAAVPERKEGRSGRHHHHHKHPRKR